jgi:hypothetical protein
MPHATPNLKASLFDDRSFRHGVTKTLVTIDMFHTTVDRSFDELRLVDCSRTVDHLSGE